MNCPRCNSGQKVRNGIVRGLQRYLCKTCNNNFTVTQKATAVDKNRKRQALIMFLSGTSVSTIARLIDVSHVSVGRWIQQYVNAIPELVGKRDSGPVPGAATIKKDTQPRA